MGGGGGGGVEGGATDCLRPLHDCLRACVCAEKKEGRTHRTLNCLHIPLGLDLCFNKHGQAGIKVESENAVMLLGWCEISVSSPGGRGRARVDRR